MDTFSILIIFLATLLLSACDQNSTLDYLTFKRDECWHNGGKFSYEFGVVKENVFGRWYGYKTTCEKKEPA